MRLETAALVAVLLAATDPASATTFSTTSLTDIARWSSAVIQGDVIAKKTLLDSTGLPWTIYTLAVNATFAGELAESEFSFRIIGGPTGNDGGYFLVGAPTIALGDSIVIFYDQRDECQVAGLEFGVFWRRDNERGESRLVDFRDHAVASFSARGVLLSGEVVPRAKVSGDPSAASVLKDDANAEMIGPNAAPAAAGAIALDELSAFARQYVTKPAAIKSTTDLTALPNRSRSRPPPDASAADPASTPEGAR
jgi:hypothetical protein